MEEANLHVLLQRYAEGRCTPEEEAALMQRLLHIPDDTLKEALDRYWDTMDTTYRAEAAVSERLYNNLRLPPAATAGRLSIRIRRWAGWAAALLFAVAAAFYFQVYRTDRSGPAAGTVHHAAQRERITLPDGSYAILNAGTTLSFAATYGGESRTVSLDGEAFFHIRADKERPFTVNVAHVAVDVLGTSFNIEAYRPAEEITITVTEGRVDVKDSGRSLAILQRNEQLVIDRQRRDVRPQARRVIAEEATAWHRNDLYFDNVTMGEAADILRKRFGADIVFASAPLQQCRFSGTLLEVQDAAAALDVICTFNNMTFSRLNGGFLIDGKGCNIP